MRNHITIEFCSEDRERLDRLTATLERRACDKCVETALAAFHNAIDHTPQGGIELAPQEDAQEAPKNAQDGAEAEAPTTAPQEQEQPTAAEPAPVVAEETATATRADVQQAVIALSTAGKKAEVREIVLAYAERVTLIPEDKLGEVYAKLTKLAKDNGLPERLGEGVQS